MREFAKLLSLNDSRGFESHRLRQEVLMINNQIIIAGTALCKKRSNGKFVWLVIKQSESPEWELPKTTVRKGESSVRATIRMMGEVGGMNARVIEEAGRFTGTAVVNNRTVPKRILYYLMIQKSAGEMIGFNQFKWLTYEDAVKKLDAKREKDVMKKAKSELKIWTDDKKKRRQEEEEEQAALEEEAELEKEIA